jgi:hypothetical protein
VTSRARTGSRPHASRLLLGVLAARCAWVDDSGVGHCGFPDLADIRVASGSEPGICGYFYDPFGDVDVVWFLDVEEQ